MTRYDHDTNALIVSELKTRGSLTCTELCESLNRLHGNKKKIRYAKVWEHLDRLCDADIVKKSSTPGRDNERHYSLTPASEYQLEYGIFDLDRVETRREDPANNEETRQRKYKKILTLLILQAATGSFRWKVAQKVEPGLVLLRNPETGRSEAFEGYNEKGVTTMDVVESRDCSNDGIFLHINFDKSDIEKCYKKLIEDHKELASIIRKNVRENREIEFSIEDDNLRDLIRYCSCMISYMDFITENILKLDILKAASSSSSLKSIKQRRKFIRKILEWYVSSFGRKRFNSLYASMKVVRMRCRLNNEDIFRRLHVEASCDAVQNGLSDGDMYNRLCAMISREIIPSYSAPRSRRRLRKREEQKKKLKEEIQHIERNLRLWNESILHIYHCRISCDKHDIQMPQAKKYYNFVRNMPQEFCHLRDVLVDVAYPQFLKKEHEHNPELVQYVNTLPVAIEESKTKQLTI